MVSPIFPKDMGSVPQQPLLPEQNPLTYIPPTDQSETGAAYTRFDPQAEKREHSKEAQGPALQENLLERLLAYSKLLERTVTEIQTTLQSGTPFNQPPRSLILAIQKLRLLHKRLTLALNRNTPPWEELSQTLQDLAKSLLNFPQAAERFLGKGTIERLLRPLASEERDEVRIPGLQLAVANMIKKI